MTSEWSTTEAFATLVRRFAGEGHDLTLTLRQDDYVAGSQRHFTYLSSPPPGGPYENAIDHVDRRRRELKAEYKRRLSSDAKLVMGYQLQTDDNAYDNLGVGGASQVSALPHPGLTGAFLYRQQVNAL